MSILLRQRERRRKTRTKARKAPLWGPSASTARRPAIAFGRARILEGEENLRRAANKVGAKYSAGYEDLYMEETEDTIRRGTLCCVEITIDHMTGKIGKEVMKERRLAGQKTRRDLDCQ